MFNGCVCLYDILTWQLECVAKLLPKKDEPQDGAEKEQGAKDVTLAQGLADELKSLKDGASESERPGPKESWIRLSRGVVYVALEVEQKALSGGGFCVNSDPKPMLGFRELVNNRRLDLI